MKGRAPMPKMTEPASSSAATLSTEATHLKDQIRHALDEALILITGAEILIGFQYTGIFNKGFESLPMPVQYLQLLGLVLLLLALILIMSPVSYHQIVERGRDTRRFIRIPGKCFLFRQCSEPEF